MRLDWSGVVEDGGSVAMLFQLVSYSRLKRRRAFALRFTVKVAMRPQLVGSQQILYGTIVLLASLFADAGIICIASLISPFRKDRDACRALLAEGDFIEVFLDVPLNVCEARDPKGLYKLSRAGKIQGFTGIDDPYEEPLNSEIVLQYKEGICSSPNDMAERVISYLEERGHLQA